MGVLEEKAKRLETDGDVLDAEIALWCAELQDARRHSPRIQAEVRTLRTEIQDIKVRGGGGRGGASSTYLAQIS